MKIQKNYRRLQSYLSNAKNPSDLSFKILLVNFIFPILGTFIGYDMTLKLIFTVVGNLIFIAVIQPEKLESFKKVLPISICFYMISVLFGLKLMPTYASVIWAFYAGSSSILFDLELGIISCSIGSLLFSPLLVLDWMRWWQVWPIPSMLGISFANIILLILIKYIRKERAVP
jgi:hypothetical protein